MANYNSTQLLVALKAYSRANPLALDSTEVWESLAEAKNYAQQANAYPGQTIKALLDDGKYHSYVIQPSEAGYTLEEVGAVSASDLKQYVMVVDELPESGQEQGILYICDTTGSIWTGSVWKTVFHDVQTDLDTIGERIDAVEAALDTKAPLANPVFSGVVKVGEEEVALKTYVDGLFANLEERCATPEIVDSENPIPADYKAGYTYRVAEDGEYAGVQCEVGDLILVVKDYVEGSASNDDFMVLQANIDGAVTSTADVTTVGEIVVFDAVTGRVIKGSGVQIASLNDAIAKVHEHANKEVLDTYDKSQTELLTAAKTEAQGLVDTAKDSLQAAIDGKANKATTLEGYGITDAYNKTEIDSKISTITENLNTKISAADVDTKISDAKTEILESAAADAAEKLNARVGDIPESTTIKEYVDSVSSTGSADVSTEIAKAKQSAIDTSNAYTDSKLTIVEF